MRPKDDDYWMGRALQLARRAALRGEVPVGAVVVRGGVALAGAGNQRERRHDATAHAEVVAIRAAGRRLSAWRLSETTVYVTLEPCAMCAGAMVLARVARLVYGAREPKAGAGGSVFDIPRERRLNHRIEVEGGVRGTECAEILTAFFRARRKLKTE